MGGIMEKPTEKQAKFFAFNPTWRFWEDEADEILEEVGITKTRFKNGDISKEEASKIIGLTIEKQRELRKKEEDDI